MQETTLKPVRVTLESSLKLFGLQQGSSEGSLIQMTFEIPEGFENNGQLLRLMLREKEKLDLFCLSAERLRGTLTSEEYQRRRALILQSYASVLDKDVTTEGKGLKVQTSGISG